MTRRSFPREFKIQVVKQVTEGGVPDTQAAGDLGIRPQLVRQWCKQFAGDAKQAFPGHGRRPESEEELDRLRKENARLKAERDILKKAVGFFAKDS